MRIAVLDSFTTDQGRPVWGALQALGEVALHPRTAADEIVARCAGCTAVLTNKVPLRAATLAALPDLRYVGVMATGTNILDIDACRARGIAVTNVPGYSTEAVAQLVFALVLHFTNDVAGHWEKVRTGGWVRSPDFSFCTRPVRELAGRTLVVIGSGAIGGAAARIGAAFGMRIVTAAVPGSATPGRTPLAEALAQADVVTLHCPLTPQTQGLVDRAFLARLKPGAILVNTGRGPLLDDVAVAEALADGRLGGVGLDVLAQEPPPADHPLLRPDAPWRDRLAITPHIGWASVEARERLVAAVVANLRAFRAGERVNRVD